MSDYFGYTCVIELKVNNLDICEIIFRKLTGIDDTPLSKKNIGNISTFMTCIKNYNHGCFYYTLNYFLSSIGFVLICGRPRNGCVDIVFVTRELN